jgi:DNA methylase
VLAPSVRALKPGGHMLMWALPRTSHWTARAIDLAGLEIRDVHHDAIAADSLLQAFMASLDSEQLKALARLLESQTSPIMYQAFGVGFPKSLTSKSAEIPEWAGTALKPSVEHWLLARKPLEGTVAANFAKYGTGVLNIDACRIGHTDPEKTTTRSSDKFSGVLNGGEAGHYRGDHEVASASPAGRWPAHFSLQHAPGCEVVGATVDTVSKFETTAPPDRDGNGTNFAMGVQREAGKTTIPRDVYRCAPGCPVAELDAQSGADTGSHGGDIADGKGDVGFKGMARKVARAVARSSGGASRFFFNAPPNFLYVGKASRREKDAGLAHLRATTGGEATGREDGAAGVSNPRAGAGRTGGAKNSHPTVKSLALMRWLLQLVVPPGGTILDPFAGSATTGVAALGLGMSFIGCEQGGDRGEYLPIFVGRIRHALGLERDLTITAPDAPVGEDVEQDGDEPRSESEE